MSGYSVKLRPGDRLEEGDQIYVASAQVWHTVKKGDTVCGMVVGTNSNCRRPVSRPVTNPITNDAAGEWEEEETEDGLTSEEELENELAEANQQIKKLVEENMELHNRLQRMQEHVDGLKKQLAALEGKLKAQEKTNSVVIQAAEQERTRLITERDNLRQEVHNLQHSLAVERRRLESLDVGSAEQPETEVEKLAREVYIYNGSYSAKDSFQYAEEFIAERDRRRKEFGK